MPAELTACFEERSVSEPPNHELAWAILDRRVSLSPEKDFLRFRDGTLTYAGFAALATDYAGRLSRFGIARGDIVPTFLPNGSPAAGVWFALMRVGAVWMPINTEFRGEQLIRALNLIKAPVFIVDSRYLENTLAVLPALPHVRQIIVHGGGAPPPIGSVNFTQFEELERGLSRAPVAVERTDLAMIQFTSGSTGISKAVQLPHGYLVGQARLMSRYFDMRTDDVVYCPFPLYHWDATIGTVMGALVNGATAALADRFSVSRFWDDIRAFDATMFDFMGATLAFLFDQPPSRDREHRVRLAWGLPMPKFRTAFEKRFGFPLLEGYGSTEGGVSVYQVLGETYPKGSCGRVAREYDLKLIRNDGSAAQVGEVGEILTKPYDPTMMMSGYYNMPEVNSELIQDGWYHTGDLGRMDSAGNLYFAGRKKDIIRRRGENISALEIEREVESHPAVLEAAAFGVPSPFSEEDVAVAVVLRHGAALVEEDLRAYCADRMARYMVPQHILLLDQLPKTQTEKVAKAELKRQFANQQSAEVST
jgi:crotonobetaine/carnitine-CoA ligase